MKVNIRLLCISRFQFDEWNRLTSFVFSFSVVVACDFGREGNGGGGGGVVFVVDV